MRCSQMVSSFGRQVAGIVFGGGTNSAYDAPVDPVFRGMPFVWLS